MKRSRTSSGLNTSHGTASKTCVARRMSNLPRGSGLRCSKPNMPFFEPSFTTTPPHWRQSQLGKRWCSAAGSFWDDPQSTPLRTTAHTFWMRDWSSFGLRIGLLSGPWYVPNVMLLQCRRRHAEQMQSRVRKVATLARTGEKGRALAAARNAPPVPVTEQIVQEIKSLYPADPEPPAPAQAFVSGQFMSEVAEHVPPHSERCHDSVNQDYLACVRNIGMTSPLAGNSDLFVQVVAHKAAAAAPNPVLQYLKLDRSHRLPNPQEAQTTPHDVFSPQTCAQISNGSKERISGQVCGTFAAWCWKTRWSKHDDQDHPIPCGS